MKTNFLKTCGLISLILILFTSATILQAQPGGKQGPQPIPDKQQIEKMVSDLSKELSLNDTQQRQVSEMFVAHFKEVKEVQDKYKATHEAERKEMDSARNEFEKEVKTVLTPEQQKQFDEFMKNRKAQHKAKGQRPPKQ